MVGLALLAAGCVRFGHQTSQAEPHGIVQFVSPPDRYAEQPFVKTFDGLPVSAGPEYRVRPGPHELVFQQVDTTVEIHEGTTVDLGAAAQIPIPGTREVRRRTKYVTNLLSIEASWFYVVDGENIRKTRVQEQ